MSEDCNIRCQKCKVLTFEVLEQDGGLVVREMCDGWGTGGVEQVVLHLPVVSVLPRQQSLVALPLVQVVPCLGVVHVQPASVCLVVTVSYLHAVTCVNQSASVSINDI